MKLKKIILSALIGLFTLSSFLFITSTANVTNANGAGLLQSENTLPSAYCMRDEYVVLAQNQDNHGYCWNFASTMAATTTIMKATGEYYDFSELWTGVTLNVCTSKGYTLGAGGSFSYNYDAIKQSGLMLECDLPYQYSYTVSNENATDYYNFFEKYSNDDLARSITYDSSMSFSTSKVEDIKKHLLTNGSLYMAFSFRSGFIESNGAYYLTPNQTNTNSSHAVSLVGWDDDYQKEFYLNGSATPTVFKGAWIILNSYTEKSGKDGLSYVFYDDKNITSIQGYRYQPDINRDLYFYDKIESGYQFSTNLKGSYYGDLTPQTSLMKQKNIFYDDVNLEYSFIISDGANVKGVDIFLSGQNVTNLFSVDIDNANNRFSISKNDAPYGQYKIIVTYGNDEKTDTYLNNFFVTHGLVGEEIEYDYDNSTFTFNPGRDLEFYSFIHPEKNFVIYTDKLNGKVSFLQTETSVYSEKNMSLPTIYYEITNGENQVYTHNITANSGYTLSYNFNFEYCTDTSLQPVNVFYDLGGGVNHSKNYAQELSSPDVALTLYAPTRQGYTFDGWYLDYGNGSKKIAEKDGVYYVDWEDIHHLGESPSLNAKSYYKKYYNNSNTLFVYAHWQENEYHNVNVTIEGQGSIQLSENITVCAEDSVRYIFNPSSNWCLHTLIINGEKIIGDEFIEVVKYGLTLTGVDEDLSILACFEEGILLSLKFGENVKTAYLIGEHDGVSQVFYDGDFIPYKYFEKSNDIFRPIKKSPLTEQIGSDLVVDLIPPENPNELPPLIISPWFNRQFTLVVELVDSNPQYTYVLDNASSYTPLGNGVFQKTISIDSRKPLAEIDVGSATIQQVEQVEVKYEVGSYVLDHYISANANATSGEKGSAIFNAGQIVYLFIKPNADNFMYHYRVPDTFSPIGNGWYKKAVYVTADEPNLGKITVYRERQTYVVTWLNWDGSEIYHDSYHYGDLPVFDDDRYEPSTAPTRPDDGIYSYVFTGWDKPVRNVNSNATYTATYKTVLKEFTIDVDCDENGTVTPTDGDNTLTYEEEKTYAITPSVGYEIKDVLVNGTSVGKVESYTFSQVKSNQTLKVVFEKIKYSVSVICGENGTTDCSDGMQIEHGESLTVNITPDQDYCVSYIKVNGEEIEVANSFTLTNVIDDTVIEIGFDKIPTPETGCSANGDTSSLILTLGVIILAVVILIKKRKVFKI